LQGRNGTNTDIYDAIRDLEPNPKRATELDDNAVFMIFMSLLILLLGCLGFIWLHP
jgi:hypothetical protein